MQIIYTYTNIYVYGSIHIFKAYALLQTSAHIRKAAGPHRLLGVGLEDGSSNSLLECSIFLNLEYVT
jgi:hypothetical protein